MYGDTALIGAIWDDDNGIQDSGSVYVFTRSNSAGTFIQQSKIHANDAAAEDFFGRPVSLYDNTALIGATGDLSATGAVYVFTRSSADGTFTQQDIIRASDAAEDNMFGASVSLFKNTALIGAYGFDGNRGAVYEFTRLSADASSFTQQDKIIAIDANANDLFGVSVSLYEDTALIGSTAASVDDVDLSGCVYIFTRASAHGTLTEQTQLVPSDSARFDFFGTGVSLYGNEALIGASHDDDNGKSNSGSVYVFNSAEAPV